MSKILKGSPEALAWARKMKKARIRAAGKRTEVQFFGPGGEFADEAAAKRRTNPNGDYTGTLKLPTYIDRAVARVLYEGSTGLNWEWDHILTKENKQHFEQFLVRVHHPLAYQAGTAEWRYKRFILDYVMPYIKKNPDRPHGKFRSCVRQVSRQRPKVRDPKAVCGAARNPLQPLSAKMTLEDHARAWWKAKGRIMPSVDGKQGSQMYEEWATRAFSDMKRRKRNPITIIGNPPKQMRANVSGILYQNVIEVRAEKTGPGPHKGLWYHVFRGGSQVQMLALDTGDVLLHSKAGKKLWRVD